MDREPINPYLEPMLGARRLVLWIAAPFILLLIVEGLSGRVAVAAEYVRLYSWLQRMVDVFASVSFGVMMIGVVYTWLLVFLAAYHDVSAGYAWRQLVLAVVFTPILLMGVVIIPLQVRNDLVRRRNWGAG